jgi:DNA-binding MarR family transcriptional regulator
MTDRANELARFIEFLTVRFKESERLFASQLEVSERELALMHTLAIEGPMITKALGARFKVPVSTMTGLVDRMEEKGLLRRVSGRRDRRSIELELTPAGALSLREHSRNVEAVAAGMLSALSARDQETLIGILRRVREKLEGGAAKAAS